MALYGNTQLTGIEKVFNADEIIVSKTDLTGKITYGNRIFYKMAGLNEKDCLNTQHNIIRHPDMPRAVFELLWNTLDDDKEIFAYVVNRSGNGDHYWVFAHVTPSFDGSGNKVGYHSNRRVPNKDVISKHIEPLYKNLMEIEKSAASPKDGINASYQAVVDLLAEKKLGFNELMFALGE
ncbi:MAG: PAS domain-containing protein [Rhodospirillaceae bacterium]|jgi:PAS domain S-box-containing protein|nr:PAS domain-containing protein [Rhodospirillaceae bacterium]MBT4491551.1 PAS domain-containing protein [Rhodospirillaceae bacterium]MBT4689951.1 PAS domain-containing protein [Rhodospirillaceae bacterium]MBT6429224.1 PAS domain-containing protein [Rhodospirillaceae bacterium]MBT7757066.1 PAS domain-containing protein [Rhodospirillaceae bacterium]